MPNEAENQNKQNGENAEPNPDMSKIQVDKTEFEQMQKDAEKMRSLEKRAKDEYGFDSYDDYQDTVEELAMKASRDENDSPKEKKPES